MKPRPKTHRGSRNNDQYVGRRRTEAERQIAKQPIDSDSFWDRVKERTDRDHRARMT